MAKRDEPEQFDYESPLPFRADRIRAAALYCSDGRFGDQVDDLLHHALALPCYDRLAVPGGAACLVHHFASFFEQQAVVRQLEFLVTVHGLCRVVLIAHQGCAYYLEQLHVSPGDLERRQRADLAEGAERVRSLSRELTVDAFYARTQDERVWFERLAF